MNTPFQFKFAHHRSSNSSLNIHEHPKNVLASFSRETISSNVRVFMCSDGHRPRRLHRAVHQISNEPSHKHTNTDPQLDHPSHASHPILSLPKKGAKEPQEIITHSRTPHFPSSPPSCPPPPTIGPFPTIGGPPCCIIGCCTNPPAPGVPLIP